VLAALADIAWTISSPGTYVSHINSRLSCRRSGCPRRGLGGSTHATASTTDATRIDTTTRTRV